MTREQTKAARYIEQLDQARCNGDWDLVPELVRKVRKHAPHRTCLTLVAESEYTVVRATKVQESKLNKTPDIAALVLPLAEAIENERTFLEDEFQAKVCLAWIYWVGGDLDLVVSVLPRNIEQDFAQLDGTGKESAGWTKVCALKGSYIRGTALVKTGHPAEALETFEAVLPILSSTSLKAPKDSAEQRTWTELLLTQFCLLSSQIVKMKPSSTLESETLSAFRAWASFWDRQRGRSSLLTSGYAANSEVSRRQIWKEYYVSLSIILQQGLPYPTTSLTTAYVDQSTRLLQREELQRVESKYEELLLQEVQFPRADQANEEVEQWVELVVQNWRVLCGANWMNTNPDQAGKEATSRRVLEILYRAATKTFHSTSLLRHLFTVHLAVGEFDLAFKAFDTYFEIVKKGKARVEKTGEVEDGLDNDETVLKTASQCIRALCRYGSRDSAQKAQQLGHYFEEWLDKHQTSTVGVQANGTSDDRLLQNGKVDVPAYTVSPLVFAAIWRSIGIAKAHWTRLTFDAMSRSKIQKSAIDSLQKALLPKYASMDDVETLFALAMVLAERREISGAIDVVKRSLLPSHQSLVNKTTELGPHNSNFAKERSLIPLWHLLALLLSARQEFATAIRACEGAFEQFKDPKNLFGAMQLDGTYRSEHLNATALNEKSASPSKGLVDDMDDFEKQTVLEVKMTQLVLIEVIDGPQVAVNASDELLSLYTRLFGEPHKPQTVPHQTSQHVPPQSSAGTLKSIKGSIFGRSRRSMHQSSNTRGRASSLSEKSTLPLRPQTAQTHASTMKRAPTIHVTNETVGPTSQQQGHERTRHRSASLSRKKSHASLRNRSTSAGRAPNGIGSGEIDRSDHKMKSVRSIDELHKKQDSPAKSTSRPLPTMSQNMVQEEESLQAKNVAQQDTRLPQVASPAANPVIRFSKDQERRRRIGILVNVWLLIAGFYRRAELYEDSKGATDEAYKLVKGLELDISSDITGNPSIYDKGWGSYKSVEELWGDVWSERGYLSTARDVPYEALSCFETSLNHFPDHPSAIVGLSNILLDIYSETLLPPPSLPTIGATTSVHPPSQSTSSMSSTPNSSTALETTSSRAPPTLLQPGPLGVANPAPHSSKQSSSHTKSQTALLDRLAARDRAYGLLSGLTKLGTGWNYSDAWFALARAHEEAGQVDKARDALWWCVELEEGKAVRSWDCVAPGGYVL